MTSDARRGFINIMVFGALGLAAMWQLDSISGTVQKGRELEASPISYDVAQPDKDEYYPGETIHLWNVRHCHPTGTQPLPILLLTLDSFENIDTGEVWAGTQAARVVKAEGDYKFEATRVIPSNISPGTYVFEGWASSQISRLARAAAYTSKPFKVLPLPPER